MVQSMADETRNCKCSTYIAYQIITNIYSIDTVEMISAFILTESLCSIGK